MADENTNIILQKLQAVASISKEAFLKVKEVISQIIHSADRANSDYVKTANRVINILEKDLEKKLPKKERNKVRKDLIKILNKVEKATTGHRQFLKEVLMLVIVATLAAITVYAVGRNPNNKG